MAAPNKSRKKDQQSNLPPWFNEVVGIGMAGFGVLLMLSLVSFTPGDMPVWGIGMGPELEPNDPRQNWIGVAGALIAWLFLMLFGAAAYLLPVALLWLGLAYAGLDARWTNKKWIGMAAFMVTGSCLIAVLPLFDSWARHTLMVKDKDLSGGMIGYGLGELILEKFLNTPGSVIVLGILYLIGMILLTGIHPVKFLRVLFTKISEWRAARKERKEKQSVKDKKAAERKAERDKLRKEAQSERDADRKTAAVMGEKPITVEKKQRKKAAVEKPAEPAAPVDDKGQVELGLKSVPAPQIIDASQKKVRPSVEPGAKLFEKKKTDSENPSLSTDGFEGYELPGFDLLDFDDADEDEPETNTDELIAVQKTIVDTLKAFGVDVTAGDITRGPTITRYEVYPSMGLRVSRITQLEADIARATKAERINILAPIPGKDTVGIEIANDDKVAVPLRELLQDEGFTSAKKKIPLALGKDVYGNTVIGDLAAMPHLLVAGATGSGKSVCINSIITSILFKFSPDELRFIMVDPKVVEMQVYGKLPHLVVPVVTDPNKVVSALRWVVNEMEKRYKIFAKSGVRNFDSYNGRPRPEKEVPEESEEEVEEEPEVDQDQIDSIARAFEDGDIGPPPEIDEDDIEEDDMPDRIPYIVVIIDELADLMQTAPADVEMNIARIAQKARAAGIHLIVATQTPRADVVTGIIKANIPSRIAFQVSSALDSRVILDTKGADKLVGKGDMLYLPPGSAKLERAQGAFVSDEEVEKIVEHCSTQSEQVFEEAVQESIESGGGSDDDEGDGVSDADEEIIVKCIEVIKAEGKASTSLFQRRLRLGYTRAARMVDILEERRIIGPQDGARAREVYIPTDVPQ